MTIHSRRVMLTTFVLGILPGAAAAINSSQSPQILPRAQITNAPAGSVGQARHIPHHCIASAIGPRHGAGGFTVEPLTFVIPVINLSRATFRASVNDCAVNG